MGVQSELDAADEEEEAAALLAKVEADAATKKSKHSHDGMNGEGPFVGSGLACSCLHLMRAP